MTLILPSVEFVVQDGFTFVYDEDKGLWRSEQVLEAPQQFSGYPMTPMFWNLSAADKAALLEPPVPDGVSEMWEHPTTVVGEIVAYRGWDYRVRLAADGAALVYLDSLHQPFPWHGPVVTANEPPSAGTCYGLHAVDLAQYNKNNFSNYVADADIWGRVGLSGLVVEGEYGYRAERVTIQELWVNPNAEIHDSVTGLCKALGDRYQCEVSVRDPVWDDLALEP